MLAGVDYVLMGAGIPTQVAGALDKLAHHKPVSYRLDVHGAGPDDDVRMHFDPERIFPGIAGLTGQLKRPGFLPIISSTTLAQALIKRSEGAINGFVVEGPTAGGHNAPPRGPLKLNDLGEPIYGEKDVVDPEKMKPFGLPFWFGGGYGSPEQVKNILAAGATGVQVGTAFALCDESGMEASLKQAVLRQVLDEAAQIFTSPNASPTGFPFKVALVPGTMSDPEVYAVRNRICDLGFLRVIVRNEDGSLTYRCSAEPVDDYVRKGGQLEDTEGRACLCNNLLATAGYGQHRKDGAVERAIVTSGDDLVMVGQYIPAGKTSYSAEDVLRYLLGLPRQTPAAQGA
jgi:NAD(P)H-dependent flavin oxidoreductase YrpB (nitropropane dioxygenase family)